MVFHWERRDLVLLRDILRLGTATSALLPHPGQEYPARRWYVLFRAVNGVAVPGTCVRQPDAALRAQPRAVARAQRRDRQLKHQRVPQGGLKIEQIAVQQVAVRATAIGVTAARQIPVGRLVGVELLQPDLRRGRERIQAASTLTGERSADRSGLRRPAS